MQSEGMGWGAVGDVSRAGLARRFSLLGNDTFLQNVRGVPKTTRVDGEQAAADRTRCLVATDSHTKTYTHVTLVGLFSVGVWVCGFLSHHLHVKY